MLHSVARRLTAALASQGAIASEEVEIYVYGFEILISSAAVVLSFFCLSLLMGSVWYAVVFLLVFTPIRLFSGGFHASTYLRCFLVSNILFLASVLLALAVPLQACVPVSWVLTALAAVEIVRRAPVVNPNHPIGPKKAARNKRLSRVMLAVLCSAIFLLGWMAPALARVILFAGISLFDVAILMTKVVLDRATIGR